MLTITNYISSACLTKSKSLVFVGPPAVELILSLPTEPHGKNNRGGFWPPQVWLGQILQLNFPSFPFGVGLGGLVVVGGNGGSPNFPESYSGTTNARQWHLLGPTGSTSWTKVGSSSNRN